MTLVRARVLSEFLFQTPSFTRLVRFSSSGGENPELSPLVQEKSK